LKRAREEAGRTQEEAAEQIDAASSKVSRVELGQSGIKQTDLTLLLALEDYTDATYLDRPDGVHTHLWNRLQAAATGQVESRHMILRLADAA
jgi:transcriptional regulator with XRE-family HTH domain